MDKQFWFSIRDDKFMPPAGHNVLALTEGLFSYLGSTDPELRDAIAYETFANWLDQDVYSPDEMRGYILRLLINLQEGLGERDTDTVFLRSFSALSLAEVVNHDNQEPFLDSDEVHNLLEKGLAYLEAEADPRGYVPDKGWAHALAHTADLLMVLGQNRFLNAADLAAILYGITDKLIQPTGWVYVHGEDDRLVRAVLAILRRKLLESDDVKNWLGTFTAPKSSSWKASFEDEAMNHAYFNTRTFLRSFYLRASRSDGLANKDELVSTLLAALQDLKQF